LQKAFSESIEGFIDLNLAGSEGNLSSGGNGHNKENSSNNEYIADEDNTVVLQPPPPKKDPSRQHPVLQVRIPD
jgi:hypothetical protein